MKIAAIIILYQPEAGQIRQTVDSILPQVDYLCLADNSDESHQAWFDGLPGVSYLHLGGNRGIAAAQNAAIHSLPPHRYDFLLFCDQDSRAEADTVGQLALACSALQQHGLPTGGVGTRAVNRQTGRPYAAKSREYETFELAADDGTRCTLTRCSYIRSSISLIPSTHFDIVGGFDERLFIDAVDNEWCWRATHLAGLQFYIAEAAHIVHMLGEGDRRLAGRNLAISSPFRIYFQLRNYLWLCRRPYVPAWWKRHHALKYLAKIGYYPLCCQPRLAYLKQILRGLRDGLFRLPHPDAADMPAPHPDH